MDNLPLGGNEGKGGRGGTLNHGSYTYIYIYIYICIDICIDIFISVSTCIHVCKYTYRHIAFYIEFISVLHGTSSYVAEQIRIHPEHCT